MYSCIIVRNVPCVMILDNEKYISPKYSPKKIHRQASIIVLNTSSIANCNNCLLEEVGKDLTYHYCRNPSKNCC